MNEKKEEWEIGASRDNVGKSPSTRLFETGTDSASIVGQMLDGRFLIERDLTDHGADAGGIGLIYLAQDLKLLGRKVVVKILQAAALSTPDLLRKFRHEREALVRLDHPGVVRILDYGELADGNPFIVMEFIEGRSLRGLLAAEGKLPLDRAAHIISATAEALGAAHSRSVLHRDVKPENIMLTPQEGGPDRVRLIDFGIARVEESVLAPVTAVERGIGTILYIAPEQLLGKIEQTPAVDVYPLAIVAYEMLTGELPFKPTSIAEMFQLQKEGLKTPPRELRPEIPEAAERILLAGLEFDTEKRPADIRRFGRQLAAALVSSEQAAATASSAGAKKFVPAPTVPVVPPPIIDPLNPPLRGGGFRVDPPTVDVGRKRGSGAFLWPAALAVLAIGVLSVLGIFAYLKGRTDNGSVTTVRTDVPAPSVPVASAPERRLAYHLMVQKMRDGKPFEVPFRSSGQEIFESGYKFTLVFSSRDAGWAYLFAEESGSESYNILYPTPKRNDGSAEIAAGRDVETGSNTFSGTRGTEVVWLIWTAERDADLEAVKTTAFAGNGKVTDAEKARLLADYLKKHASVPTEATKDQATSETVVKGSGPVVIRRIELEHR